MTALREFRDRLLRMTFDWCAEQSPFYRRRFAPLDGVFRGLEDLGRLPLLFRDEAAANIDDLLCARGVPACVQYTTGTTGTFFQMYRSAAEITFIQQFFNEIHASNEEANGPRPLCLALTSAYHGSPTPVPCRPYVIPAGVYDRTQATQARRILEHEYTFDGFERRVSIIVGGDILIKALTAFLIAQGFDFESCGVRSIVMTGGYVTAERKQTLARIWGANVIDRYSLSEIFGGAVECGIGGPWAFDIEVIPEVVHPRSHEVLSGGIGTLVLTGLYPFMQMMPMVRYYTGDLVEVISRDTASSDLMVRFLGRERRSILDLSGSAVTALLPSAPLHDAIEQLPDVACSGRFADLGGPAALEFAGKRHYAVEYTRDQSDRDSITVTLGLRYPPYLYPDRVTALCTELRQTLYERCPDLASRVRRGDLEFRIVTATSEQVPPFNAK